MSQALRMLVAAYAAGAENGGSIDWSDLDDAYNQALKELGQDGSDDGSPSNEAYVAAATSAHHRDGECEIDPGALVSRGEDAGAYVQAWIWVSDDELPPDTNGIDVETLTPADLARRGFANPMGTGQ